MNFLKSPTAAVIALIILVIVGSVSFVNRSIRPSESVIKSEVEKQMKNRLKNGGAIVSTSIIRGATFPSQAHFSKVPVGTLLYPVVVKIVYTVKQRDGTMSENKELNRTFNFYKDSTHQWVNDDELH